MHLWMLQSLILFEAYRSSSSCRYDFSLPHSSENLLQLMRDEMSHVVIDLCRQAALAGSLIYFRFLMVFALFLVVDLRTCRIDGAWLGWI